MTALDAHGGETPGLCREISPLESEISVAERAQPRTMDSYRYTVERTQASTIGAEGADRAPERRTQRPELEHQRNDSKRKERT